MFIYNGTMMFFPVRRCNFVLRYTSLLVFTAAIMFILFQVSTTSSDYVISFRVKELRDTQISVMSNNHVSTGYVVPTRTTTTLSTSHNHTVPSFRVFATESGVNQNNYDYLLNPSNFCFGAKVYIMIYVHSAPANFKKRMSIRETWGFQRLLNEYESRIVFVMGRVTDVQTMLGVKLEYNQYGDIVQEDFLDSYRNLTHKAIGAFRWLKHFCGHAAYVLKSDDDIFVNVYHLIKYIRETLERESKAVKNVLLCNQWVSMVVIRNEKSKWFLSKEEFPLDRFPVYCSGSAFLMSRDVVHKMYEGTLTTHFFWVDDYYITGMVFKTLQIKHTRFNEAYSLNSHMVLSKFKNDTTHSLVFYHTNKITDIYYLWRMVQQDRMKSNMKTGNNLTSSRVHG